MNSLVETDSPDAPVTVMTPALTAALEGTVTTTLLLVDWAELSYDQAALALHVPVGTIRSRLNRARRKIREALHDISAEEHHHD